jgi:hypothetical protein
MSDIKIIQVNDCDWVAAETVEEAKEWYKKEFGSDDADVEEARELTDKEMETLSFKDEDQNRKHSFKEQLELMREAGISFPAYFASTEV